MPPSDSIRIDFRRSKSLTSLELAEIWAVTSRYVDTDKQIFEEKLRALPEVGLWRVRNGPLIGLVSFQVHPVEWAGRTSTIIFTSSVVIEERYRKRGLVIKTGLRILLREKLRRPWRPAFWFFDTFSYKSYLLLPRNLREFWPRREHPTPPEVARFIHHLAQPRYGGDWNQATGVVNSSGKKRLLPTTAPLDVATLADPDVRFFDTANPGHRDGDMLVCIAPLTAGNLLGAALRIFR